MATILEVFLSNFNEVLVQMVKDKVGIRLGIPGQMEKLLETVHDIQPVLADAGRKQSNDRHINYWLTEVKDALYDAKDVIELCQIKANEVLVGSSYPLLSRFCNMLSAHRIRSKIKNINSRLELYVNWADCLDLTPLQIIRPTVDRIVINDIVGEKIKKDAELLVKWLVEEEKDVSENVRVAAIVGMEAIGKTALAHMIFCDPRIEEEFKLKIWVYVSEEVKEIELLKGLIWQVGGWQEGGEHGATKERSELVPLLERFVQRKKFLLVLDDVWEESQAVWDCLLRAPMSSGSHGSRLLITTRDERVAITMRSAKLHQVDKLCDEDGWSLLIKEVAPIRVESEIQDHKDIGMLIVKKCDGMPLAIKNIGNVLRKKGNTRSNWLGVLSFEDLPLHLKQCLIFCSLFPKDFVFNKSNLIYMWLSEEFLKDQEDFMKLGNEYYRELLRQNFLKVVGPSYDQVQFKMHDIWWSVTRQLEKGENYVLGEGQVIQKAIGLRTLLLHLEPEIVLDDSKAFSNRLNDMCRAYSNLRILDLNHPNFSSIPNSLCNLVFLRYLNVSGSNIRNLPNSIGKLKYLIYLNLANCEELSQLPRGIINLRELKFLNTYNSGVQAIPVGLSKLNKLVELHGFRPYKNNLGGFSNLDELKTLSNLLTLELECLENVSDIDIAKKAILGSKNQLRNLYINYMPFSPEEQLSQSSEKKMTTENVLNELLPSSSLEILKIEGYFGSHLPNWFNLETNLPNLRFLEINNCACFEGLAPLGQLLNLDFLRIIGAFSVESVGEEFFWGDIQSSDTIIAKPAFPKLCQLIFDEMSNWKEWQWSTEQLAMPNLKKLFLIACPQLRSLPEGLLHDATSLEYLEIHGADQLITIENLPSIKEINVSRNPKLERISNLDSVSSIEIYDCPNLEVVMNLNVLETMALTDFGMKILPNYLTTIVPQELRIQCSDKLFSEIASQGESSSECCKFKHIPTVKINSCSCDRSFCPTYPKPPFSFTTNDSKVED